MVQAFNIYVAPLLVPVGVTFYFIMKQRDNRGRLIKGHDGEVSRTHGMTKTSFYHVWHNIKQRCNYKRSNAYKNYGGRGIRYLWNSFEEFRNDMYKSYLEHIEKFGKKETTIERIDNNGHYCKENCTWVTFNEQARNKRDTWLITFYGQTLCISEWAKKTNINSFTIYARLHTLNWSIKKTLTTPIHKKSQL